MLDEVLKVELGGFKQKIHIVGDPNKPIMLFLHGGPGVANRHTITKGNSDLREDFMVVGWDQRGTGGSYWGVKKEDLTIDQIAADANDLIEYLCKRFNKKKVFIVGGSWGSLLGTVVANRYPEHVAAYIGFGQFVDGPKNEELSFKFSMEEAVKANDEKAIKDLEEVGPPVNGQYKGGYDGMLKQRNVMMKYGGYSKDSKKRNFSGGLVGPMLKSHEYTIADILGIAIGHRVVLVKMWPEVGSCNLLELAPSQSVPYYILDGRLDNNTPAALVEDYFAAIDAKEKDLIWFENSGHNPLADEPEAFKKVMKEKLLKIVEKENLA